MRLCEMLSFLVLVTACSTGPRSQTPADYHFSSASAAIESIPADVPLIFLLDGREVPHDSVPPDKYILGVDVLLGPQGHCTEDFKVGGECPAVVMVSTRQGRPSSHASAQGSVRPPSGFVPDAGTALWIAEAVMRAGLERHTDGFTTEVVMLREGVWTATVRQLRVNEIHHAQVEIARADGRILEVRLSSGPGAEPQSYSHVGGLVRHSETAAEIAKAVLSAVYGAEQIDRQRPFLVSEIAEGWRVTGQLPRNVLGGVGLVEIARSDGRILRMTHGR